MARHSVDLRRYLRRPDREFWLEVFRPAPAGGAAARLRRQRLSRFALGAATLITAFYAVAASLWDLQGTWLILLVNCIGALLLATGMWMASLGQHAAARNDLDKAGWRWGHR